MVEGSEAVVGNSYVPLRTRLYRVFTRVFDLGFTAFGGPPVHIQIFHRRFVEGNAPWIDERTFQELFVITQALPGPGSTKLLFNIVQVYAGVLPAIVAFTLWSLPGAAVMYGLSLAVQRIGTTLPGPVYALLSGLNAATVGGIALSATQLARKAISDRLTRSIVLLGACAGLIYNALWYYPVLIVSGGLMTLIWDLRKSVRRQSRPDANTPSPHNEQNDAASSEVLERTEAQNSSVDTSRYSLSIPAGMLISILVIIAFLVLIILRGTLNAPPKVFALFTNMYIAGTLIFGGGPVVIPLLREYVVEPGWVSPRDFLLGLAIIQALPGPNFNFAVYLGSLALAGHVLSARSLLGALMGFIGIFTPGIVLSAGIQSVWHLIRDRRVVISLLRGMNAAAVGLVFTAVYRLWEVGYLTPDDSAGISLAKEPWWLAITATAYTSVEWFDVPIPLAIVGGGAAGLLWWDVVK
ncbi:hypothetical protein AMATHDRAFT_142625 [Amanita thiersii Skay4041]|uniref:Chromate transporter n=1 Tax=Amanita thiersii Skay4041 TaxID=703135 RepID=A0A2A9NLF3_9AGAR|nr:hypothetical protein AMATHDRAFT_142625 [Amanita thiersii Skay4041]